MIRDLRGSNEDSNIRVIKPTNQYMPANGSRRIAAGIGILYYVAANL
jgi:hypothetical protein